MLLEYLQNRIFLNYLFEPVTVSIVLASIIWDFVRAKTGQRYFFSFAYDLLWSLFNRTFTELAWFLLLFYYLKERIVFVDLNWIPRDTNGVLIFLGILLYVDFFYYWFHRFMHHFAIIEKIHLVHHNVGSMVSMSSQRLHLIERLVENTLISIYIMSIPQYFPYVFEVSLILRVHSFVNHHDFFKSYGFLDRLIVSPSYHRIHHARDQEFFGKNYALFFSFWDKLFKTQVLPASISAEKYKDVGVPAVEPPENRINSIGTLIREFGDLIFLRQKGLHTNK